jgi:hypothetical protein
VPLLTPEFLDHDDLTTAARHLLIRHQDDLFVDWQSVAFYGPRQLGGFIGRTAQALNDPMYAQNVLLCFHTMSPHAIIRALDAMGLQAGLTGRSPARPESSDEDLLAAIKILDHPEWVGFIHMSRVAPRRVLDTLRALTSGQSPSARRDEPGYEVIDLGLRLGMDTDWFATLAADADTANVSALRTMMALRA